MQQSAKVGGRVVVHTHELRILPVAFCTGGAPLLFREGKGQSGQAPLASSTPFHSDHIITMNTSGTRLPLDLGSIHGD